MALPIDTPSNVMVPLRGIMAEIARIVVVFGEGHSDVEAGFTGKDGHSAPYYFNGRRILIDHGQGFDRVLRKLAVARKQIA